MHDVNSASASSRTMLRYHLNAPCPRLIDENLRIPRIPFAVISQQLSQPGLRGQPSELTDLINGLDVQPNTSSSQQAPAHIASGHVARGLEIAAGDAEQKQATTTQKPNMQNLVDGNDPTLSPAIDSSRVGHEQANNGGTLYERGRERDRESRPRGRSRSPRNLQGRETGRMRSRSARGRFAPPRVSRERLLISTQRHTARWIGIWNRTLGAEIVNGL